MLFILSTGVAQAQVEVPGIQSDSAANAGIKVKKDFENSLPAQKAEEEVAHMPTASRKNAIDTAASGQWIKYNVKTGERTVVKSELPEELPESAWSESFEGIMPEQRNTSVKNKNIGDDGPGVEKWSGYKVASNPSSVRNRKFVKLKTYYTKLTKNGKFSACSGTLIDQEWVLTAGHCVKLSKNGGMADSTVVIPAFDKGNTPFGKAKSVNYFVFQNWDGKNNWGSDMALIQIDRPVGVLTGYYSYGYQGSGTFYKNKTFYDKSYPAEGYRGDIMYKMKGTWDFAPKTRIVNGSSSKSLAFQGAVAVGGTSGSSAYSFKNDLKVYAVSSHTLKYLGSRHSPTFFTRINSTKYNKIKNVIQNSRFSQQDLVALDAEVSSKRVVEGKELDRVEFTVFNKGTGYNSEQNYKYDLYLSDDPDISRTDTHLGSYTFKATIDGRETYNVWAKDVKIPSGKTGTKYIGFILDVSDKNTDNNDTDGWDAQKIQVKPAQHITVSAETVSGTDLPGTSVEAKPSDISGKSYGQTDTQYKYASGSRIYLDAPTYVGAYIFQRWEENGSTISRDHGTYYNVKNSETLDAIYDLPAVPVTPHEITARLPEKYTQGDSTVTLKIVNKHSTDISWNIDKRFGSPWLNTYPSSGTANAGGTSRVTVSMSSAHLKEGGYKDTLLVSNSKGDTARVLVALAVGPPPHTVPSPSDIYKANQIAQMVENMGFGTGLDIGGGLGKYFMGVGASGPTTMPGRAFVKTRTNGSWSGFTELPNTQALDGDQFGSVIDIFATGNNPFLAVGAPGLGPNQPKATVQQTYPGKVVLFNNTDSGWQQTFSIQPGDLTEGAQFGASIAIASDPNVEGQQFIAIGAPNALNSSGDRTGKVYIYKYIYGDLAGHVTVTPKEGVPNDFFGKSIDLVSTGNNPFLVVGAPGEAGTDQTGYAEIYRYTGESWSLHQTIRPEKAQAGDGVGSAVAMSWYSSQPILALGAPRADLNGENSGGIYTYHYSMETESWESSSLIAPEAIYPNQRFGKTLQLYKTELSTLLLAGAPASANPDFGGEAMIYRKVGGDSEWLSRSRLKMPDQDGNAGLGQSAVIAPIDGQLRFFAGAPKADVEGTVDAGIAYQFALENPIKLPRLMLGQDLIQRELQQEEEAQEQIEIKSTGKAALTWSLDTDKIPWVDAETDSGTIQPGNTASINLNLNTTRLDTGIYRTDDIVLYTNDTNRDCTYISMELQVTDKPTGDLLLSDMLMAKPDSVGAGAMLDQNVEAWLANAGTDPIDSTITVGLYLSSDNTLSSDDSLFASTRIDTGLTTNEGTIVSMPRGALVPESAGVGSAYFIMVADYGDKVPETDESNNTQTGEVTLLAAPQPQFGIVKGGEGFNVTLKQNKTTEGEVRFENTGNDTLFYSISWFAPTAAVATNASSTVMADSTAPAYLSGATPATGGIAPGDTGSVMLGFSGENVPTGTYEDTVSIVTNDPDQTTILVPLDVTIEEGTALDEDQPIPDDFALKQNYPNPFNPTTQIRYELPKSAHVTLSIYNMLGRRIATLVDDQRAAGVHSVTFEAGDLPSGAYIYRIKAGSYTETRKMMLLK